MKSNILLTLAFALLTITGINAQCNNLLTNGNASSGLTGWSFSSGGGATWSVQNNTYGPAFVASYNWTTMNQTIDLYAQGYTSQYLDNQQPEIAYSQMYRGRASNFSDKYYCKIELKNASNQVMDSYTLGSQNSPITTTSAWDTVSGSFTSYGTGARYIRVECGGDDAEYWSGNYGTVIDNSVVSVAEVHNVGICSGTYTFNNQTLSSSGTYTGSFTGSYGCDSNVVLNLHIGPYNIDDTFNLCKGDTFMYNSQPYTTSTTISGQFTSAAGCDSNISYTLDFIELFDDTIWASICPGEFYQFGSLTLFSSGTYTDQFTSQYACDSNVVLVLSESPAQFENHAGYICENGNYTFGDTTLTAPGGYFRIFQNSSGCDSIVNLTLAQDFSHDQSIAINLCDGDTLFFGAQDITEPGSYQETFQTLRGGCDSLVSLDVTVTEIDAGIDVSDLDLKADEDGTGTTYQWLDCKQNMSPILRATSRTYTPNDGGKYAVEITKIFCTDTSDCKPFWPLGLNELGQSGIVLYPNPATDILTIQTAANSNIEWIRIMDNTGRIVYETRPESQAINDLNISDLVSGLYHLQLEMEKKTHQERFTKQ